MSERHTALEAAIGGCLSYARIIEASIDTPVLKQHAGLLVQSLENTLAYAGEIDETSAGHQSKAMKAYSMGLAAAATLVEFAGHPVSAALIRARMEEGA